MTPYKPNGKDWEEDQEEQIEERSPWWKIWKRNKKSLLEPNSPVIGTPLEKRLNGDNLSEEQQKEVEKALQETKKAEKTQKRRKILKKGIKGTLATIALIGAYLGGSALYKNFGNPSSNEILSHFFKPGIYALEGVNPLSSTADEEYLELKGFKKADLLSSGIDILTKEITPQNDPDFSKIEQNLDEIDDYDLLVLKDLSKENEMFKFFKENKDLVKATMQLVTKNRREFYLKLAKLSEKIDIKEYEDLFIIDLKQIRGGFTIEYLQISNIFTTPILADLSEKIDLKENKDLLKIIAQNTGGGLTYLTYSALISLADKINLQEHKDLLKIIATNPIKNKFEIPNAYRQLREFTEEFIKENKETLKQLATEYNDGTAAMYKLVREKGLNFIEQNKDLLKIIKQNAGFSINQSYENLAKLTNKIDIIENKEELKQLTIKYKNKIYKIFGEITENPEKLKDYLKK